MPMNRIAALILLLVAHSSAALASAGPQPLPAAPAIAAPRDIAFRGAIGLQVDATDLAHKILRVKETIPVQKPGPMVLLYPQWETASHSATLEAAPLAGLVIMAGSRRLDWRRDAANPFAFHLEVPAGVAQLDITFQHLPPMFGPKPISAAMLMLPWQKVVLYPAGWFIRNIAVQAALTVPPGFAYASALETASIDGDRVRFKPGSLEDLVDAPIYAGLHVRRHVLSAGAAAPVRLTLFGDSEAALAIPPALLENYRALAAAVPRLFRSRHYRHFDVLMSLSDVMPAGGGTEHQESTEINLPADYFSNAGTQAFMANLVPHEFIHSWNGRTRQPADLWQPNLNLPVGGSLLWLYEGQSEFWAGVLAPRVGLQTVQQSRDALALEAGKSRARAGRQWKSLQDSTIDALYMPGKPVAWRDWQRREDYYGDGVLLWLDVDMLLRELSGDQRSLADFAATFFGAGQDTRTISTYTFADVCKALGAIAPYDWAGYFGARLDAHDDTYLLDGLRRAGYRLVYAEAPTDFYRHHEADLGAMDLSASLGLAVGKKGIVKSVAWEGPAFRAGVSLGARLSTVDGQPYTDDVLKAAIKAAATSKAPITLGYEADGAAHTAAIDYTGSLRYPHLERIPGTVDRLERLLTAPL
jgi:predicted metalloprotease with PDZ domain